MSVKSLLACRRWKQNNYLLSPNTRTGKNETNWKVEGKVKKKKVVLHKACIWSSFGNACHNRLWKVKFTRAQKCFLGKKPKSVKKC